MIKPKFSFVILTWNRSSFLEKCLASLLDSIEAQEANEIIILDNGSTDQTNLVLDKYEVPTGKDNLLIKIIRRKKNYGLNSYKKLFNSARGEYIVVIDDDVLSFPKGLDKIFEEYMKCFPGYGFLALDVIQNEFTNGAKPPVEEYSEEEKDGKIIQSGPAGGWCACFRKKDYRKISLFFNLVNITMSRGEDGLLTRLFGRILGLKSGIIKNVFCFHACGPHYSTEYGYLERDIEKYKNSGLTGYVDLYKSFEK